MTHPGIPEPAPADFKAAFDLSGRVAIITGGAGLLGVKHGEAIAELGGIPVLVDIAADAVKARATEIAARFGRTVLGVACDITSEAQLDLLRQRLLKEFGRIDILVNNAANNPKVEDGLSGDRFSRFENFPLSVWNQDIAVGLTGAFLCSRIFGTEMAARGKGVILNIASEYGLIGPDQRIYSVAGRADADQPVKAVTYPVVKAALIGMTRYLATYWPRLVRANVLAPGGVYAGQPEDFLERLIDRIPMGRMADKDEYKSAVAFLVSDASSYMNGAVLSVDGGRTAW